MKIRVLKKLEHKGCLIYIRNFETIFEYLIVYDGQLYSHYFDIEPTHKGQHYTEKQLEGIVKLVLMTACKVIEELIKKK